MENIFINEFNGKPNLLWLIDMKTSGGIDNAGEPIQLSIECYSFNKEIKQELQIVHNFIPSKKILPSMIATYNLDDEVIGSSDYNGIKLDHEVLLKVKEIFQFIDTNNRVYNGKTLVYNIDYFINTFNLLEPDLLCRHDFLTTIELSKLAKKYIPIDEIGNYQQASLYAYFYKDMKKYRALKMQAYSRPVDNKINLMIFCKMMQMLNTNNKNDMFDLQYAKVKVKTMPFGKYKGWSLTEIAKLDPGYFKFMLTNVEFVNKEQDLAYTMKELLNM